MNAAFVRAEALQHVFKVLKGGPEHAAALELARELERESGGAFVPGDLLGLAKGFIADRMAEMLSPHSGAIDAGGDFRFFGQAGPFSVHVRLGNGLARELESPHPGVASSSLSESLNNPDSTTRYPLPLREGLAPDDVVTTLAPTAAVADAMTKVALFARRDRVDHCARLFDTRVVIFAADGSVRATFG